ncbi:MAG: transposase [Oscillospiraceae bacterium]|nr:transposase [Oscillospiraceae bacterium]
MEFPQRKRQRLRDFDYSSQHYYFVTICCSGMRHLFANGLQLNKRGMVAQRHIEALPSRHEGIYIDKYVVMPNHIHMIVAIGCDGAERSRPFPTLSTIIGQYKSGVSRELHGEEPNLKIWQKSFNDHIIRNKNDYEMIWQYIDTNPAEWELDCFHPQNQGKEQTHDSLF